VTSIQIFLHRAKHNHTANHTHTHTRACALSLSPPHSLVNYKSFYHVAITPYPSYIDKLAGLVNLSMQNFSLDCPPFSRKRELKIWQWNTDVRFLWGCWSLNTKLKNTLNGGNWTLRTTTDLKWTLTEGKSYTAEH
jgi:hypothetical protein